jgi:hypothetical protein
MLMEMERWGLNRPLLAGEKVEVLPTSTLIVFSDRAGRC